MGVIESLKKIMKTPENTPMNDCPLKNYCYLCSHNHGVVLEWLKRHAWKACIPQKGIPSSNLGHSAKQSATEIPQAHLPAGFFVPHLPASGEHPRHKARLSLLPLPPPFLPSFYFLSFLPSQPIYHATRLPP